MSRSKNRRKRATKNSSTSKKVKKKKDERIDVIKLDYALHLNLIK
jgi:hypothetical protein